MRRARRSASGVPHRPSGGRSGDLPSPHISEAVAESEGQGRCPLAVRRYGRFALNGDWSRWTRPSLPRLHGAR